jgi:hypothetical protein
MNVIVQWLRNLRMGSRDLGGVSKIPLIFCTKGAIRSEAEREGVTGKKGIEPPSGFSSFYDKVLHSPVESRASATFPQDETGPKAAEKDPKNPEKRARPGQSKSHVRYGPIDRIGILKNGR